TALAIDAHADDAVRTEPLCARVKALNGKVPRCHGRVGVRRELARPPRAFARAIGVRLVPKTISNRDPGGPVAGVMELEELIGLEKRERRHFGRRMSLQA